MNVYWAGGEDVDFTMVGIAVGNSGAGAFDSAFSRGYASANNNGGSVTWPMTNYVSNPVSFGNQSSFWLHIQSYFTSAATVSGSIVIGFADSGGVGRILIRGTGTSGQLKISSRNAAGTIVDFAGAVTASGAFPAAGLFKIDVFVNYSSAGRVQLYINGAVAADTGAGVNVTTDSATSLSFFYLSSATTASSINAFSEVIVADSDTRTARLWLMNSSTAGNAQTWTGTASSVNKVVINDTTFISAASAGLINEYKTGGITLPAGAWAIAAVVMSSRALGGSAGGPTQVAYLNRVGSTDYVGRTWAPPVGSFGNNSNFIQATNPGTGSVWTPTDLTATTFNYGVQSVA